jgi:hypothetical protein
MIYFHKILIFNYKFYHISYYYKLNFLDSYYYKLNLKKFFNQKYDDKKI